MSRRRRSALRNRFEYQAYRAARAAARALGPWTAARLGSILGNLFWTVGRRRREIIHFNLSLAYPELDETARFDLARRVSRHFGRMLLDTLRIQTLEPGAFLDELKIEGLEHAAAAAELGRGVFYLTGHIGSWEVAALAVGLLRPESLKVINRPLDNPLLDDELARLRGRFGNQPLGKAKVARGILQQLRDGGAVGILIDQRVTEAMGVEVPFFGQPTWTHPILARMVRRTGAPVVPVAALWNGPGEFLLRFLPPVVVDDLPPEELEDAPLTARFSRILEEIIRDRPQQWLWYHDRWRHLRVGEDSPASAP